MKKVFNIIFVSLLIFVLFGCNKNSNKALPYRIVDRDEAIKLYTSNDEYFNSMSEYDLQYRTQSKDGTIEDLKEYGVNQIRDFTDKEKEALISAMEEIEGIIKEKGYHLPKIDEITFIKTTQKEEGGAVAYTHGTQIYMNNIIPIYLTTSPKNHQKGLSVLIHEIFHCLTRNNPDFRKQMYSLINFNIVDEDFVIPEEIKQISISNPDVERHDAYASFTINNSKKDCYMLNISTKPFKNKGDSFASYYEFILVPVNKEDKDYYFIDESSDYWDVFGENTKYIADPEECMADNFGYALAYGLDGSMNYPNPEIIQGIIDYLTNE